MIYITSLQTATQQILPDRFLPGDNLRTGAYLFMHAVSSRILLLKLGSR